MNHATCVVCLTADAYPVYRLRNDPSLKRLGLHRSRVRKVMCATCGLVFSQPRLDDSELSRLYAGLRSTAEPTEEHLWWKRKMAGDDFAWIAPYLPSSTGTVLDIGCSEGSFLYEFAQRGWNVLGVEPSAYADYGRRIYGLEIRRTGFEHTALPPATFDAVSALRVLEHVPDPVGFLLRASSLLKREGVLYLEVPDAWRPRHDPREFLGVHHLFLFTRASLSLLMQRAGLAVIRLDDSGAGLRVVARRERTDASLPVMAAERAPRQGSIRQQARALRRRLIAYRMRYLWLVQSKRALRRSLDRLLGEQAASGLVDAIKR